MPPAQPDSAPPPDRAPSLLRYAPALVLLAIAIADAARVADTDLWGHIAFGRLFLTAGPLRHDPFNYSVPGHAWVIHEWLAELTMARIYDSCGILGLKWWKFACTALTIILLASAAAETGASPPLQAVVLIVIAVALMPLMQFRPHLYTYIFLAALLALLARENYRRRAPLWLAIPILALWANLHGGFVVGVAVLALYTGVVTLESLLRRRDFYRCARLAAVTAASAAATLANPYGLAAWSHVLGALNNPVTRKEMVDWQPLLSVLVTHGLHAGGIFFALVVALLTVLAIAVAITPRGGDLPLVAIAAVLGAAAFNVVRNMPLALIASAAPLARHLHLIGWKFPRPAVAPPASPAAAPLARPGAAPPAAATLAPVAPPTRHLHLIGWKFRRAALEAPASVASVAPPAAASPASPAPPASSASPASPASPDGAPLARPAVAAVGFNRLGQIVIFAAALILMFGNGALLSARLPAAMDYPVGAVAFIRAHRLHGNLLARFEWGQYLIFHLAPSSKVFIDGRVDLVYPPSVIDEYLDFFGGQPGGVSLLDRYPHDYVLMPTGTPSDATVSARPDWKLIYRDPVAVLFAHASSPAARLPGVPFTSPAPPSAFP